MKRTDPERRSRLSFLVARSQGIVVGEDLPALADALQGLVVEEGAIHDADGRLVLDRDGGFDPRAFAPRSLLVFGALGEQQASRGLPATRLGRAARTFFELPMRLQPDVKERLARLQEIVTGGGPVVELTEDGPLDVDALIRRVRAARGLVFDGWAYYDGTGHALLTHDRKLDPAARLP